MAIHTFTAPILPAQGGGAYVEVPIDVEAEYGVKRLPVRATFDGIEYRGTVMRMRSSEFVLGILKGIRTTLGKEIGDMVEVTIEQDAEERVLDVPDELAAALAASPAAQAFFEGLSFSQRRYYVNWVAGAKRVSTRSERIAGAVEALAAGRRFGEKA